jgi:hypothetical protein
LFQSSKVKEKSDVQYFVSKIKVGHIVRMEVNFQKIFDDTLETDNVSNICTIHNEHLIIKRDIRRERHAYFGRFFSTYRKLLFWLPVNLVFFKLQKRCNFLSLSFVWNRQIWIFHISFVHFQWLTTMRKFWLILKKVKIYNPGTFQISFFSSFKRKCANKMSF